MFAATHTAQEPPVQGVRVRVVVVVVVVAAVLAVLAVQCATRRHNNGRTTVQTELNEPPAACEPVLLCESAFSHRSCTHANIGPVCPCTQTQTHAHAHAHTQYMQTIHTCGFLCIYLIISIYLHAHSLHTKRYALYTICWVDALSVNFLYTKINILQWYIKSAFILKHLFGKNYLIRHYLIFHCNL